MANIPPHARDAVSNNKRVDLPASTDCNVIMPEWTLIKPIYNPRSLSTRLYAITRDITIIDSEI